MVDVRNIGNVWGALNAGNVSLRPPHIPLSAKIEKNPLRKDGWYFEPSVTKSWHTHQLETQKTDDPVIFCAFSLSGMLTSYPVDFRGVVAVMKRRCKGVSRPDWQSKGYAWRGP